MTTPSGLFSIICECCGAKIDVDPQTRSIFYTEKKGMKKKSFEEAVVAATTSTARAQEHFEKNLAKEKNRKAELDKLFQEAKKKAEQEPNERPKSIFDYD